VLVVEDEQDIAGLIKHTLERDGDMAIDVVSTGDAALKAVSDRAPDLLILDLNLPVLGGLEVCRILRSRPATSRVPIIMVTARTSEADRVAGLDVGADDYVVKPSIPRKSTAASTWWQTSTRCLWPWTAAKCVSPAASSSC
jgi:DNA-binding response OmpR family regulator